MTIDTACEPGTCEKLYTPRLRVCRNCGVEFLALNRKHRYCSGRCRDEARFGRRICPECGAEFIPRWTGRGPTTHCSRECYERSRN